MYRNILALVVLAWTAGVVAADTKADSVLDHQSWDVGTVPRGTTYHHFFQITNNTDKPMHIGSIRVSCGCVSASAVKKELAPGEQSTIVAQIETRQFSGVITKTIFILVDQPRFEEVRIHVQANVLPDLSISPSPLRVKAKHGARQEASTVISLSGRAMSLDKATSESAYVQARVEPVSDGFGGQSYRVTAKVSPELPVGTWYCSVSLSGPTESSPVVVPMIVEIVADSSKGGAKAASAK